MSLLDEAFTACTFIIVTKERDGYGSWKKVYTDGAAFEAAITFDNSIQARIAQQSGVNNLYTVTTRKSLTLEFHDIFRRESDGKIFRVTSDGDDKHTPQSAALDMRQVSAEEFVLPQDE